MAKVLKYLRNGLNIGLSYTNIYLYFKVCYMLPYVLLFYYIIVIEITYIFSQKMILSMEVAAYFQPLLARLKNR